MNLYTVWMILLLTILAPELLRKLEQFKRVTYRPSKRKEKATQFIVWKFRILEKVAFIDMATKAMKNAVEVVLMATLFCSRVVYVAYWHNNWHSTAKGLRGCQNVLDLVAKFWQCSI